jgi:abequosyltransferase
MQPIKLSICIPTRNFGKFIGETLQSIIVQAEPGLEIVVVDGASSDNTEEVLESTAKSFPYLRWVRQDRARGVDFDLAVAVQMAQGQYCWLMSADDVLRQGAIRRVMSEIETGLDTYIVNRTECTLELRPIKDRYWLDPAMEDHVFDFSDTAQISEYFEAARSIGALFSFISSIVVARERWLQAPDDAAAAGTNYQHAYRLFGLLLTGGKHKYIKEPLVYCRGDNDSFMQQGDDGLVRRFLIDIDGYYFLGQHLFEDVELRRKFMAVMRQEHSFVTWVRLAVRVKDDNTWRAIRTKLITYGYSMVGLAFLQLLRRIECRISLFAMVRHFRLAVKSVGS